MTKRKAQYLVKQRPPLWIFLTIGLLYLWWRKKRSAAPKQHPDPHTLIHPFSPENQATRIIPLETGINFRDIGGYHTTDGHITCWGKIYRSGDLSKLTKNDIAQLENLELKLICDLRTKGEVEHGPNRLPPNAQPHYHHTPIYDAADQSAKWFLTLLLRRHQIEKLWVEEVYINRFIEERAAAFGRLLTLLAEQSHYPAVIHCTAGKDRTGVTIALLLAILNVPDETIIADYTLSNHYYTQILETVTPEVRRLAVFGIDTPDLYPLLTAQDKVLRATLAHIRTRYGSVENYLLTRAGVSPDTINQLRLNLLTPKPT